MTDQVPLLAAIHEEVRLVPYNPARPSAFAAERGRLESLLPGVFLAIEHIGSTAVPGMPAEPVIDLLAGVDSIAVVKSIAPQIYAAGYTTSSAFNETLPDRSWFMRAADGHRTHRLHVVVHDANAWREKLAFRDALRASSHLAAEYAALKSRLAVQHAADRDAYTDAKTEFIRDALGDSLLVGSSGA